MARRASVVSEPVRRHGFGQSHGLPKPQQVGGDRRFAATDRRCFVQLTPLFGHLSGRHVETLQPGFGRDGRAEHRRRAVERAALQDVHRFGDDGAQRRVEQHIRRRGERRLSRTSRHTRLRRGAGLNDQATISQRLAHVAQRVFPEPSYLRRSIVLGAGPRRDRRSSTACPGLPSLLARCPQSILILFRFQLA